MIFRQEKKLKTDVSGHYTLQLRDLVRGESNPKEFQVLWQALDGGNLKRDFRSLQKMNDG